MSRQLAEHKVASMGAPQMIAGDTCPDCSERVPLRTAVKGEPATNWVCEGCGASLAGMLVPALATCFGRQVRLATELFDCARSKPIPSALRELVGEFLIRRRRRMESHERQKNSRELCNLDAVLVGIDDRWAPYGVPIPAIVIDLSSHGLGVMTAQCLKDERYAIQLECDTGAVQLLGRRAWSNYVGDSFQNTGLELFARLGQTTVAPGDLIGG